MEIALAKFDLKEYARRGAATRAAELQAELAEIYRAFPDLRARAGRRAGAGSAPAATGGARRKRRSRMSAEQRKAVSARMKKYWAERRKAAK